MLENAVEFKKSDDFKMLKEYVLNEAFRIDSYIKSNGIVQ